MSPGTRKPRHEKLRQLAQRVDLDQAVRCVELSKLAYRPPSLGAEMAKRSGYQAYTCLARRDHRDVVVVMHDNQHRYVAMRGTDQRLDWLTNLRAWRVSTPYGRVHSGYYAVCADFFPELAECLDDMPPLPIIYTGHSMGGAVALLAALRLQERGMQPKGIFTFGQPQVGNKAFSEYVEQHLLAPYHRFVHGADAIAVWGMGQSALLGDVCYFDLRGRLQFGQRLNGIPKLSLRLHRLQHYRFYLRLNRLQLRALEEDQDATRVLP